MGIIYTISPDYLEALYSEAKNYNFCLQGYGNCQDALNGLLKTNISEILGFIFVAQDVDLYKNSLVKFIRTCNSLCKHNKKKFIFALQNSKGLSGILNATEFNNLKVSYLPNFEVLTDTVINRQLFGSILLDNFEPYVLKKTEHKSVNFYNKSLNYEPLFSEYVLKCLDKIDVMTNYEQTLLNDDVYQSYVADNAALAIIRKNMIKKMFGLECDLQQIAEIVEARKDPYLYCIYRALASQI